jgi:hypothetical protein
MMMMMMMMMKLCYVNALTFLLVKLNLLIKLAANRSTSFSNDSSILSTARGVKLHQKNGVWFDGVYLPVVNVANTVDACSAI